MAVLHRHCMYATYPQRLKEGIGSAGTELPVVSCYVNAGIEPRFFERTASDLLSRQGFSMYLSFS